MIARRDFRQFVLRAVIPVLLCAGVAQAQPPVGEPDGTAQDAAYGPAPLATQTVTINLNGLCGSYPVGPIQVPLEASGGSGIGYQWSYTGSLPPGLALRSDGGPSYFPSGVTGGIIGVATTPGSYPVTIQVVDSGENTASQSCTLNILSLAIIDPNQFADGLLGSPYTYTPTASGSTGAVTWSLPNSSLPPGLSLDPSTGQISGVPTAQGNYSFALSATDSTGTVTGNYNIQIWGVVISTPGDLGSFLQGSVVHLQLTAAGGTPPYTFSGSAPGGLGLSASGLISGTVTAGDGSNRFSVSVSDSGGSSYSGNFVINLAGAPTLPGVTVANPIEDATIGEARNYPLNVNGGQPPYFWSIAGSLPPGMKLISGATPHSLGLGPDDAAIVGFPTSVGSYTFNVNLQDSSPTPFTVSIPVTLNVTGLDINAPANPVIGTSYNGYIQPFGLTYPYTAQSWTLLDGSLPPGLSLNSSTGDVTGTPTGNGNFQTFLQISADGVTLGRYVSFNVQSQTTPQIVLGGLPSLPDGTAGYAYSYTISACCTPNGVTFSVVGLLPTGLSLDPNSGQLSGAPQTPGQYTVEIQATDKGNAGNYGIGVYALNISFGTVTSYVGTGVVGQRYLAAFEVPGIQPLTFAVTGGSQIPPGLSVFPGGRDLIGGTPTSAGAFTVNFVVTDILGNVWHGSVQILIYPADVSAPVTFNFNNNLGTWTVGEIQYALNTSGGNGTVAWSVANGQLPPGLALRSDAPLPSFFNGATAGIIGVATTPGNYAFTLAATSGGQVSYQYCTVRITPLDVMEGNQLPPAFENTPFTYTFTAMNATGGAAFAVSNSSFPSWLSLSGTGQLTGTPPAGSAGIYSLQYQVTADGDTISRGINLNVSALQFTSSPVLPNVAPNSGVNTTIAASGGSGSYSYSASGLPGGLSLSNGGVLTGTITSGVGPFPFTVTVNDTSNNSYTQIFSIDQTGSLALMPGIVLGALAYNPVLSLGVPSTWGVTVGNGGTAPFTWTVTGLPPGMSYRPSAQADVDLDPNGVNIWGTPVSLNSGSPYNVTYTVTDANGLSASVTAPLYVSALTVDPGDYPQSGTIGNPYSQPLRVLGGSGPYTVSQLNPLINPLPDGLTLGSGNLTLTGTPLESGNFTPDLLFQDSAGNRLVILSNFPIANSYATITINGSSYLGSVSVGQPFSTAFSVCCQNFPFFEWSISGGSLPSGFTLSPSGVLSGTALPGTSGAYQFLIQVNGLGIPAYKQFTLLVVPYQLTNAGTNDNDTFGNLPYGTLGQSYNYQIPSTGGSLTFTALPGTILPPGITLAGNGLLSGTPAATGQFQFAATVSDSSNDTLIAYFTLAVYPAGSTPTEPVISLGTYSIGEVQIPLTMSGGTSYTWSVAAGSSLPPGLAIRTDVPNTFPSSASAGIIGVATVSSATPYTFTLVATVGEQSLSQLYSLKITALTTMEGNQLPQAFVGTPINYTFTALNASGGATFAPINNSLPSWLNLSSSGQLTGTPPLNSFGSYQLQYQVTSNGDTVSRAINLNVAALQFTSSPVLPTVAQGGVVNSAITASGGSGGYTFTGYGLPGGLSLTSDGQLSGTIASGEGPLDFNVTVTDSVGDTYTQLFSIDEIDSPVLLPSINLGALAYNPVVSIGDYSTWGVTVTGGGTAPFTWTVQNLPPGMSYRPAAQADFNFDPNGVNIWGTPVSLNVGNPYNVTYTVTDANGVTASVTAPLYVSALGVDPKDVPPGDTIGNRYSQPLRVLGGSGPYTVSQLNPLINPLPDGLTLDGTHLTITGTPLESGNFNPDLLFQDSAGNSLVLIPNLYFAPGNSSQIAIGTSSYLGSVTPGQSFSTLLTACCDGSNTYLWSITGGNPPSGFTLSSGGLLSGTVPAGASGAYQFLVQATDPNLTYNSGSKQFTLVAVPFQLTNSGTDGSDAFGNLPYGTLGQQYSYQIPSTGGSLTFTALPGTILPPGITLAGNGLLSGTPAAAGQFQFAATVSDSSNDTMVAYFTLAIYPAGSAPQQPVTNLGTYFIGEVQIPLTPPGGGNYVWSVASGSSLPPGLAIRTDVPNSFPANVSAGIIGVATAPSTTPYTFALTATSGAQSISQIYSLKISGLTTMENYGYGLPAAFAGQNYSYTITALNHNGAATFSNASGLPDGITLSQGGVLSGSPATDAANRWYNISFTVSDSVDSNNGSVNLFVSSILITANGVTGPSLPNATQQAFYSQQFSASGGQAPYTFNASGLPSGLSMNASGLVSGTVTSGPGRLYVYVTATDGNLISYQQTFALDVIGVPISLPMLGPYGFNYDCTYGVTCSRPYGTSAGGTAPFTWNVQNLPPGMNFRSVLPNTGSNPMDLEIWGTPTQVGTFQIIVTATDATGLVTSQTYPFVVSPLYADPSYYLPWGNAGTPYSQVLRVLGGTPAANAPFDNAQILYGALPDGLSLNGMTVSGTPQSVGNYAVEFTFTDYNNPANTLNVKESFGISGSGSNVLNLNGYTLPPNSLADNVIGYYPAGSVVNAPLTCGNTCTWSIPAGGGSLPAGLSLNSSSGVISGTISSTITQFGAYTFLVEATSGSNMGYQRYTIYVVPAGLNISTSSLPYGSVNVPYSQQIASSTAVSFAILPGYVAPPGLSLSNSGLLSGTPTAAGQWVFYMSASDANNNTIVKGFTLDVYVTTPPLYLGTGPTFGTASGPLTPSTSNTQLTATGGVAPYTYSLTPGATLPPNFRIQNGGQFPSNFSLTAGTGGLIGVICTAGTNTYNFSIRVTDSSNPPQTFDRALTMYTTDLMIPNSSSPPAAYIGANYSFQFVGYGGTGSYTFTATGLPSGLTMSAAGLVSGIPASGDAVSNSLTVKIKDSTGITESFGYTLTVYPYNITTNDVLPNGALGQAYSQTLSAPGCSGCSWSLRSGYILPGGLSLSSAGVISGTPTVSNTAGTFVVQATSGSLSAQKAFTIFIPPPTPQPVSFGLPTNVDDTYSPPATSQGNAMEFYGGTPPYTFTVSSGSLPPGITLYPGDQAGYEDSPGLLYLSGRTVTPGSYTFTIQATDSLGSTGYENFVWFISDMSFAMQTFPFNGSSGTYGSNVQTVPPVYGRAYSQMVELIGGTGTYTSWLTPNPSNPLPPGLSINQTTGVVSGTPRATGSFSTFFQATDTNGNVAKATVTFTIAAASTSTVSIGLGPTIGPITSGATYVYNLSPSGGTAPYTFTVVAPSTLPPGCSIETGNELLSGSSGSYDLACTPLAAGTYTFVVQATDSVGNYGVRSITITFAPQDLLTPTSLNYASTGTSYSQQLVTWDNGGTVTWSVSASSALPPGLTLNGSTISGVPSAAGSYTFTLFATDNATGEAIGYTFSLTVSTITITNPSILPVTAQYLTPFSYQFTATGGSGTLQWSATGLPAGLTMSASGLVSGTPTTTGSFGINVKATDGVSPVFKFCTLYVTYSTPAILSYNIATAVALPDVAVGQSYNYAVSSNVSGGTPPYTWSVDSGSTLPPGLNLLTGSAVPVNDAPGTVLLAGEPSVAGQYSFQLKIVDSAGVALKNTFNLNVSNIALLAALPPNATENTAYSAQLTAAGGTPPYTYTYSPAGAISPMLPPGISLSSSGLISGTPTSTGIFAFYATVTDSAGNHYTALDGLTVKAGTTSLYITNNPIFGAMAGQPVNQTLSAVGGTPPYTWSLASGSTMPQGMGFNGGSTGTITGIPTTPGAYSYTIHVVDSVGVAADYIFPIQISPMQLDYARSPIVPAIGSVGSPYSYQLKVDGGTGSVTFAANALYPLPPGLALSSAGLLSGTPTQNGVFNVYVSLTDQAGNLGYAELEPIWILPAGGTPPILGGPFGTTNGASVGVAFAQQLATLATGGVAPIAWTVASGSALPPGLVIEPASNGVPAYLAGIPTTAGSYTFTLQATDSAGQTAISTLTLNVSPISVSPKLIPNGVVSMPYTATVTASGGTLPYTSFQLASSSGMPPGLAINLLTGGNSFQLSGTPTQAGYYNIQCTITDSANATLTYSYSVVIDTASGNAQGIGLDQPDVVSMNYVLTGPVPAAIPITVTTTSTTPALNFTAEATGINGLSLAPVSGTAPATLALSLNTSGLTTAGTYAGVIAAASSTATNGYVAIPVVVTVTSAPPCSYTLIPNGGSIAAGGGSGSFTVSTGSLCSWTASTSDSYITISPTTASGTGYGTVQFSLSSNSGTAARTGSITVEGVSYTVTQFGSSCALSITPTSVVATAAGGLAPVSVTTTSSSCAWTASATSPLTFATGSPTSGSGNATVTFSIPANSTASTVTLGGSVTLSGGTPQSFTVTEGGINCTVSLSASSAEIGYSGGSGQVTVTPTAGCGYSTVNGPSWISITSGASGSGAGTLYYSLSANSATSGRSGTLSIGGTPFTITEDPTPCSVTVDTSTSGSPFAVGGGTGTLGITANGANCSWTASSPATWVAITSSSYESGSGTVSLNVDPSGLTMSRTATLTIAGQSVSITQGGINCSYTLSSSSATVPYGGGTGSLTVTTPTGCAWQVAQDSGSGSWLSAPTTANFNGTSNVTFTAAMNTTDVARSGTLTIQGQTFAVNQAAGPCTYILSGNSTSVASSLSSGLFTFSTPTTGCSTQAVSFTNWLVLSQTTPFVSTSGTVSFTVEPNPYGTPRTGTIQFAGQTYTVTQAGASCSFLLNSYGQAFGQAGGTGAVVANGSAPGCTPSDFSQAGFVTLQSIQSSGLTYGGPYTVAPYSTTVSGIRYAYIVFGGQTFVIKQTSW